MPPIQFGAFGFNPIVTAIALGAVFLAVSVRSACHTMLAVVVTALVYAVVSTALEPIGMPALTAPFVIVVWLFLLADRTFRQVPLRDSLAVDGESRV